ncbi:MAG: glycosyltransferase family 2 protein [Omnitrophica WOR_2 bacterium]
MPAFSIIINNFNYGCFLPEAIESALSQTAGPVEVLVVDDGSTDNSRDILQDYAGRVSIIYKDNGGQASAINQGFAHCQGDYVIFLDADDRLLPGAVQRVMEAFQRQPDAAKVQYGMVVIDGQGGETGEIKPAPHLRLPSGDLRQQELAFPFDLPWLPTSGNAFSAQVLQRILPAPETGYGAIFADYYLCHIAPLYGPVVSLPERLACYRVHGANRFELPRARLDLNHIRQTIHACELTAHYIDQHARRLELPVRWTEILSVSEVAQRLISLKLDPAHHPYPADTIPGLILKGWKASLRRSDMRAVKKALFLTWFLAEGLSSRRTAEWLAEVFLFPELRSRVNPFLKSLNQTREETLDQSMQRSQG